MADMFIAPPWLREVDDLPDGDIDIPFMEEDDPDIDIPDIDDDEELAAEDAAAGITATTDGIRIDRQQARPEHRED